MAGVTDRSPRLDASRSGAIAPPLPPLDADDSKLKVIDNRGRQINRYGILIVAVFAVIGVVGTSLALAGSLRQAAVVAGTADPRDVAAAVLTDGRSFLALGDWGRGGAYGQRETGEAMASWAAALDAATGVTAHILNAGDSFYDYGVSGPDDPQWESSFTSVYSQPALLARNWYAVLGNHDTRGAIVFNWKGERGVDRWRYPSRYYSVTWPLAGNGSGDGGSIDGSATGADGGCVTVVFVDTCPYLPKYRTKPENAQMAANLAAANTTAETAWFRQQLRDASRVCNATLVVGHHPLYSGGEHGNAPDLIAEWGADLTAYADGYIAGHDHTLQHLAAADTDFIITGAGSKLRDGTVQTSELQWYADGVNGFTVHSVNATHVRHSFVGVSGALLYSVTRPLKRTRPA